jgi:hypothetical protein
MIDNPCEDWGGILERVSIKRNSKLLYRVVFTLFLRPTVFQRGPRGHAWPENAPDT